MTGRDGDVNDASTDPFAPAPAQSQPVSDKAMFGHMSTLLSFPIRWAGGSAHRLTNTCPVDNFFAIISAAANDNPEIALQLRRSSLVGEIVLADVLDLLPADVGAAKDRWFEFILSEGCEFPKNAFGEFDLFGGPAQLFLGFFSKNFSAKYVSECSNGLHCPGFRRETITGLLHPLKSPLTPGNKTQKQVNEIFELESQKPCSLNVGEGVDADHCRIESVFSVDGKTLTEVPVCNGTRSFKGMELPRDCWIIPFDGVRLKIDDVFNLDDSILIGGKRFFLRGVIVLSKVLAHFFCYARKQGLWYFYCGQDEPFGKLVTAPVQAGKVQLVLYTI